MYTRRPDDRQTPRPPEDYSGTFISPKPERTQPQQPDCRPEENQRPEPECPPKHTPPPDCQLEPDCPTACRPDPRGDFRPDSGRCRDSKRERDDCRNDHNDRGGLLGGLLGRFRNLEFDDLLLLGLFILLINDRDGDCDNNDELLLILGLLFFMGF